ncbi:hypothetical protein AVEN_111596-1 [Araneus ventricosus]|uniref:Uncharacterized protein n=1 Tax=Araneus ventricosus TaxID=182803 RepID=A0A4Y2C583_ARAVE|nr:hypothetical protein AVEN_111596-1 [Araneus ventricosus]
MLILWQNREFNRAFTQSQANEFQPWRQTMGLGDKFGTFSDKAKPLENTRNVAPSLLGTEISRTFVINLCDVTSCRKRYRSAWKTMFGLPGDATCSLEWLHNLGIIIQDTPNHLRTSLETIQLQAHI